MKLKFFDLKKSTDQYHEEYFYYKRKSDYKEGDVNFTYERSFQIHVSGDAVHILIGNEKVGILKDEEIEEIAKIFDTAIKQKQISNASVREYWRRKNASYY